MSVDLPPGASPASRPLRGQRPPGAASDQGFRALAFLGGFLVLVVLALIAYSTTREAWPAFSKEGIGYLTRNDWKPNPNGPFGALALVYGTLLISVIALLLAVPVSIGIALFVTEVAPSWLKRPVVYVVDLLAAIPSVVYGLWGILVFAPAVTGFYEGLAKAFRGVPVLGTLLSGAPITGRSLMTAGIILAIMITPITTSIVREVFATTPQAQKEAALALGATRWEMIRASVLPHGRGGMVSGILIGLGRALGETIAVALVIGSSPQITARLFSSGDSMAAIIANQFGDAEGTYRAALIGLGVVLFLVTLVIGVIARTLVTRSQRRYDGVPA